MTQLPGNYTPPIQHGDAIITRHDPILITGANGFIGSRVVEQLLLFGFTNIRCFVRPSSNLTRLNALIVAAAGKAQITVIEGNLVYPDDCEKAASGVKVVIHLAAGKDKSFASCVLNSVVATRNLLDAIGQSGTITRFVNVSGLDVYAKWRLKKGAVLDETCDIDDEILGRADAPGYGKLKQDEIVHEYARKHAIPYVMVRPCTVYGPGWHELPTRVGISTFGLFFHLGGSNELPITYVDNCANAIVLAAIRPGVDGEAFNVVDDDCPTSRQLLRLYKKHVGHFRSLYIPYPLFYLGCSLWEHYSKWSGGQLPLAFNRRKCAYYWKRHKHSNRKLKERLGWKPIVPFDEAARRFFEYAREEGADHHA